MTMRLRKLEEKDAEGMLEWMHDPEIQKIFVFPVNVRKKKMYWNLSEKQKKNRSMARVYIWLLWMRMMNIWAQSV